MELKWLLDLSTKLAFVSGVGGKSGLQWPCTDWSLTTVTQLLDTSMLPMRCRWVAAFPSALPPTQWRLVPVVARMLLKGCTRRVVIEWLGTGAKIFEWSFSESTNSSTFGEKDNSLHTSDNFLLRDFCLCRFLNHLQFCKFWVTIDQAIQCSFGMVSSFFGMILEKTCDDSIGHGPSQVHLKWSTPRLHMWCLVRPQSAPCPWPATPPCQRPTAPWCLESCSDVDFLFVSGWWLLAFCTDKKWMK